MKSIIKNKIISRSTYKRRVDNILYIRNEKNSRTVINKSEISENSTDSSVFSRPIPNFDDNNVLIFDQNYDCDNEYSSTSSSIDDDPNLSSCLKKWCIDCNVPHTTFGELLKILHPFHSYLPLDPRTLLNTSIYLNIINVSPGKYWHFGLLRAINLIIEKTNNCPEEIYLDFNIDGIPISKSSKGQFWPILCSPHWINISPFVVGVYYGSSKPSDVHEFLKLFIQEAAENNVVFKNGQAIKLKIRNFICDAPARAYLKGIKGHNGYFACERCNVEGDYNYNTHQMCFPNLSKSIRTNSSFRTKIHEEHHIYQSPLEALPVNMINNFPLDYMHLICLGVMKKLLLIWIKNRSLKTKFSAENIRKISFDLVSCQKYTPCEFNRKARGLDVVSFWKATEFRTFLLYLGPVVLKNVVNTEVYENFMELHCAVTLCMNRINFKFVNIAETLFKLFIKNFANLYGAENISYNIHNLYHIVDDVKHHGPLDEISAFKFENHLQYLKRRVRSGNRPLEQIANRIWEDFHQLTDVLNKEDANPRLFKKDNKKECNLKNCNGIYREIKFKNFTLKSNFADRYVLTKSKEIVRMKYATLYNNTIVIYGSSFSQKKPFYEKPFHSKFLNVYKSNEIENPPTFWNTNDIICKLFKIKITNNESIFFPIVHTKEIKSF